jgi:cytochrome c oxidase cbb3-type subunit III
MKRPFRNLKGKQWSVGQLKRPAFAGSRLIREARVQRVHRRLLASCCLLLAASISACNWNPPGKPKPEQQWQPPEANKDFTSLFAANCIGCHGDQKHVGPVFNLQNETFASMVPKEFLREVISKGIHGTMMPAFAQSEGGELTNEQMDVLVNHLSHPGKETGMFTNVPGEAAHGQTVFNQSCAKCHGEKGKAGSVVDPDYLQLVSDQYLRTVVIAGRPELGMPSYQRKAPDKSLSSQDVADVVAWLSAQRHADEAADGKTSSPSSNVH